VSRLQTHHVVLGAVEDGGYDLIAMRESYPELLSGMPWGTAELLQQTSAVAQAKSLCCHILDVNFDVDTPEMLDRAIAYGWSQRI